MRSIFIFCLILFSCSVSYAQNYDIYNEYGERIGSTYDNGYNVSVRDIYGQEVGTLTRQHSYEPPKYMLETGQREGTDMTVHLPTLEDLMK